MNTSRFSKVIVARASWVALLVLGAWAASAKVAGAQEGREPHLSDIAKKAPAERGANTRFWIFPISSRPVLLDTTTGESWLLSSETPTHPTLHWIPLPRVTPEAEPAEKNRPLDQRAIREMPRAELEELTLDLLEKVRTRQRRDGKEEK